MALAGNKTHGGKKALEEVPSWEEGAELIMHRAGDCRRETGTAGRAVQDLCSILWVQDVP